MVADDKTRRLFFALWPTEALRRAIERTTAAVVARAGGKKIPTENLHITLIFLGSVPDARLGDVVAAGAEVSAPPFELTLDRLESWRRSGVLCLTAQAPPELERLRASLGASLAARKFELEDGPFQPHVTLARRLSRSVRSTPVEPNLWPVDEFVLVESRTGPQGSQYEVLRKWILKRAVGG